MGFLLGVSCVGLQLLALEEKYNQCLPRLKSFNYRPQTKLLEGNILHLSVSHSVHREGGQTPPGQRPPPPYGKERAVRILLERILVEVYIATFSLLFSFHLFSSLFITSNLSQWLQQNLPMSRGAWSRQVRSKSIL